MVKNLNSIIKYTRIESTKYRPNDIRKLKNNPVKSKDDWTTQHFTSIKRYIRYTHYKIQFRRCAYCRRKLNPLGINEHLDHIVARSLKMKWMFKPKNIILTCYQCNTQKSRSHALKPGRDYKRLPRRKRHYSIFNPYLHNWSSHFELEHNLFIKAKSNIGANTIKELKLYDYKYSIVYAEESNTFNNSAIRRASRRLTLFDNKSVEYKSAKKLIKEIERHITP